MIGSELISIARPRPYRACIFGACLASASLSACLFSPVASGEASHEAHQVSEVPSTVWHGAQDLAIYALGLIGVDYRFGGTTPERGLDCSGLVRYVFQQVTGVTLPRTSQELARLGAKVPLSDLMPGDLVFFNTRQLQFSHVGIYLGENRFIHAPRKGGEVEIVLLSKAYWRKRFDGARRLVGALPDLIPTAQAGTGPVEGAPSASDASGSTTFQSLSPAELLP